MDGLKTIEQVGAIDQERRDKVQQQQACLRSNQTLQLLRQETTRLDWSGPIVDVEVWESYNPVFNDK